MINKVARAQIPFYAVLILLLAVGAGFIGYLKYFSSPEPVFNYRFSLPGISSFTAGGFEFGSWPALSNRDFFLKVKDGLIRDKNSFIEADLSAMKLTVYKDGQPVVESDIKTKGREGSWWETPAGLYKIEGKEKTHYSSFGQVYMPWSMPFQGNFFIHGWPYYEDGKPVSSAYSGGCIRLETGDAEKVFENSVVGMPVLVYTENFRGDGFKLNAAPSGLQANSYLAADLNSDSVLAGKNSTSVLPIASLTKLVTALVAVEYVDMEKQITVTDGMIVPTSKPRLKSGQSISLYNLLPLLLMESSNEAAEAIAGYLGRERFIRLMNQKSKAIGMNTARFTDPAGRDAGNIASVEDLFALSKYIYHNRRFIFDMTAGRVESRAYGPGLYSDIKNFNAFKDEPGFIGGKVGKTEEAGNTMLAALDISFGGKERPVVLILLNTPDYDIGGRILIDWLQKVYLPSE